ncbi:hypothetical protein ACL03H_14905 [Saccharopolyspora sp. MS10]|uniref:hypothetical protein n=1 Tax=Saccharopolyspora sp. MS10 TaxID=3385973 RepID=UPI0039A0C5A8
MAGAALLVLAAFAIVAVLLAPDRQEDDEVRIPTPRGADEPGPARPGPAREKERETA